MNILDYIPYGYENAISRKRLASAINLDDATMRQLIQKARLDGALILPRYDGAGYFRPILPEDMEHLKSFYKAEAGRHYASGVIMERLAEEMEKYDDTVIPGC